MRIFERSIIKEYSNTGIMLLTALLVMVLAVQLVRYLSEAAAGSIPASSVISFICLSTLKYIPTLLALSSFLSVVASLFRAHSNSEVVVWFGSGQSLFSWIYPTVVFSLPLMMVAWLLISYVSPWADLRRENMRQTIFQSHDVSMLPQGSFVGSRDGDRVIFISQINRELRTLEGVFVFSKEMDSYSVAGSSRGRQITGAQSESYIVLENGLRYHPLISGQKEIIDFKKYGLRLTKPSDASSNIRYTAMSSSEILRGCTADDDQRACGEVVWRFGMPLAILFLGFLAIPLVHHRPRATRSYALGNSIIFFFTYQNLIGICKMKVVSGALPFIYGLLLPHFSIIVLLLCMTLWRVGVFKYPLIRLAKK